MNGYGDESRFDVRSPNTVNSMMGAVMAFVRYCHSHGWITQVPSLQKLDTDDVMRGRPVTGEEFDRMTRAVPAIVGVGPTQSWEFALQILWESGFRIGDLMDFHWECTDHIHPNWPDRKGRHPTLIIPSTQKNGRVQEIPMLPGLEQLLKAVPKSKTDRMGRRSSTDGV